MKDLRPSVRAVLDINREIESLCEQKSSLERAATKYAMFSRVALACEEEASRLEEEIKTCEEKKENAIEELDAVLGEYGMYVARDEDGNLSVNWDL